MVTGYEEHSGLFVLFFTLLSLKYNLRFLQVDPQGISVSQCPEVRHWCVPFFALPLPTKQKSSRDQSSLFVSTKWWCPLLVLVEQPYSEILFLTLIPSADGGIKPVSPKTEQKCQVVDSCLNYCTVKVNQARQRDCDWLGQHTCYWEMGAEGLNLGRREGDYWSLALCSSTFINHWTLHCAAFLEWKWLLLLCLVWTAVLWVHVRCAWRGVRGPQGDWEIFICWFWHGRMKIYGHIGMKTIWFSGQVEISAHRVTFIWADSFSHLSYTLLDVEAVPCLHHFHVSQY